MALDAPRADDRLVLRDPATGAALSRPQSWLAIFVMLSGSTFVALVVAAVSPVMHAISEHFGQGDQGKLVAYGIATVPSIGVMIGGPITGWAIDRIGSRRFLLTVLVAFGLLGSAGLYLDNVWVLVVTRFFLGVAGSGIVTGTLIMIGEYFTPETRVRVLGYQGAVGAIASLMIILSSGGLADWGGWRAPFALYLFAFVVLGLAAISIPRRPRGHVARAAESVASAAEARATLIRLWPLLVVIVGLFIGSFMPTLQVSFLLAANGVMKASNHAFVLSASAVMVAVGAASYSTVRRHLDDRATLRLCAISLGLGIVTMGFGHGAEMVALGCAISGYGTGLLNPQVNNMLISRSGQNARGRAVGLGYTARYGGDFLNPVFVGPLTSAFGIHHAVMVTGAVFLGIAALDLLRGKTAKVASI